MAIAEPPLAPPHDLEAEQSVLGAIFLSDVSLYGLVIQDGLRPQDFYREQHRIVYQAMIDLYNASEPVDIVTVKNRLREAGRLDDVGGEAGVESLAGMVPAAGNLRHYARIVRDHALLRSLLTTTMEIQASVLSHDAAPRDLVERAEKAMLDVGHDERQKEFRSIHDVLDTELEKLHRLSQDQTSLTGVRSGYTKLDELTGGFQNGNLVVIAARPSMGKSALVTNIAENAAIQHGVGVALFSLEMSEAELAQRFIASQAAIKGDDLRKGRLKDESKWKRVLRVAGEYDAAPLYVDDSSDIGILDVRAKARRLLQQHADGLGLILIDYLQLMRGDGRTDNRVEQIGQISRGLKTLARELDCPVIALSQLNRGVEQRTDKRPVLSDLRESGSIEQDADLVMFIYRDEYYDHESEREGIADLIIAKHRNGGLGNVELAFQKEFPRFMSYAGDDGY